MPRLSRISFRMMKFSCPIFVAMERRAPLRKRKRNIDLEAKNIFIGSNKKKEKLNRTVTLENKNETCEVWGWNKEFKAVTALNSISFKIRVY